MANKTVQFVSADMRIVIEQLRLDLKAAQERIDRMEQRARQCVEASGVQLSNPSGEPFDELSNIVQALVVEAGCVPKLEERIAELEKASEALVERLNEMEAPLNSMCSFGHIHGVPYTGPNWGAPLTALRAALDAPKIERPNPRDNAD